MEVKTESSEVDQMEPQNIDITRACARVIVDANSSLGMFHTQHARNFLYCLNPHVVIPSEEAIEECILNMYKEEKEKLKQEMASITTGISLSFDLWTAATTQCFICLTAHYVDMNWKLNRKILNFCLMHELDFPERLPELLNDWGIEKKISSLTFDDSFVNHTMQSQLKSQLALQNPSLCDGEFFHVRCFGRVLTLMALEGLDIARNVLDKIRKSVDYVKDSRIRMRTFKECTEGVGGVDSSVRLHSEMPSRWDSTHLMLESAIKYQRVFESLHLYDDDYKICPSPEVWKTGEKVCAFFLPFYETASLIPGTSYPTSNLLFLQVWKILCVVVDSLKDEEKVLKSMAEKMFVKIKKYWDQYSVLLAFGVVLDPRMKFSKLADCYSKVEAATCESKLEEVKRKLYVLFEKYSSRSTSSGVQSTVQTQSSSMQKEFKPLSDNLSALASEIRKSALDVYLDEPILDFCDNENLDVLQWWKSKNNQFPDLSTLACDVLSIPITTVLSESPFNYGSCFLEKYRDDFVPDNAEVMICTRNWMSGFASNDYDDDFEDVDFEQAFNDSAVEDDDDVEDDVDNDVDDDVDDADADGDDAANNSIDD